MVLFKQRQRKLLDFWIKTASFVVFPIKTTRFQTTTFQTAIKIHPLFLLSVTDLEYTYFRWFGIIVGTFDIIVGGIGNGLTIAAFASNSRLRNTFNIFIINLSMVNTILVTNTKEIFLGLIDFMTAVFMMPMNVVAYWFKKWVFPPWACKIQAFVYLRSVTMISYD